MEHELETSKPITISGNDNKVYIQQNVTFDDMDMGSLWKRIRWLITGKVKILVKDSSGIRSEPR